MKINISSGELKQLVEERLENAFKFIYTSLSEECKSAVETEQKNKDLLQELFISSVRMHYHRCWVNNAHLNETLHVLDWQLLKESEF